MEKEVYAKVFMMHDPIFFWISNPLQQYFNDVSLNKLVTHVQCDINIAVYTPSQAQLLKNIGLLNLKEQETMMAAVLIGKGLEQAKIKILHKDKIWKDSDNQTHVLASKTHAHPHKCTCISFNPTQ